MKEKKYIQQLMAEAIKRKERDGGIITKIYLRHSESKKRISIGLIFDDNSEPFVPEVIKEAVKEYKADEVTFVDEINGEAIGVMCGTRNGATLLIRSYKQLEDGTFEFGDEEWDEKNVKKGSFSLLFD